MGIFTDDTKFYSIINSVRDVECDLDSMQEWSRTWLLNVNVEKCKVTHSGKLPNISYSMKISTSPGSFMELSEVNFEKDLTGVWRTSTLKPSLHCDKAAAANATKFLGLLKRTFSAISKDLFIFLYKT